MNGELDAGCGMQDAGCRMTGRDTGYKYTG